MCWPGHKSAPSRHHSLVPRAFLGIYLLVSYPVRGLRKRPPPGKPGPPEQREVAGMEHFSGCQVTSLSFSGCGGVGRNRNALVGQAGAARHAVFQHTLPGKTDRLPGGQPGSPRGLWQAGPGVHRSWALRRAAVSSPPGLCRLTPETSHPDKSEYDVTGDPTDVGRGGRIWGRRSVPLPGPWAMSRAASGSGNMSKT